MDGFVDDRPFTFAVEGGPGTSFAQGIWRDIMADNDITPNLTSGDAPGDVPTGLARLQTAARNAGKGDASGMPPVHLWNPPYCGEIGLRIAADGVWFYQGSPIGRMPLVKLFASILRKDPERYVLVTPVEMIGIEVEDAPFLAVELEQRERNGKAVRAFRTNVDDWVEVDAEHPLRFERGPADGIKPYVRVRGDLWALVKRALLYDLVELGIMRDVNGIEMFGIESAGEFFAIAPAAEMNDLEQGNGTAASA
jgi:hypothetical protein